MPANQKRPARELLVEGDSDQHVVWSLLEKHKVPETFSVTSCASKDALLAKLRVQLKPRDEDRQERLGILIDADESLETSWREVQKLLQKAGYIDVPIVPASTGIILKQPDLPVFGVWLMPNNQIPGKLENFIEYLVPAGDVFWPLARERVDTLPNPRFAAKDQIKAFVHTWLAWQEQPGMPMGKAISMNFLNPQAPLAQELMNWLQRLFVQDL